jgi:mannitol operon repressor
MTSHGRRWKSKLTSKELTGESDRACALIAGAALSEGLRELLAEAFFELENYEKLFFEPHALLSDFASRTELSFALGLISSREQSILNIIRRIRNAFAHSVGQFTFDNDLIIKELSKLPDWTGALEQSAYKKPKGFFINLTLASYLQLVSRRDYVKRQKRASPPEPIYKMAKRKT